MPAIRRIITAATGDAMAEQQNNIIPEPGAILNLWASAVTKTDALGLLIGTNSVLPQGTQVNIEASADVIDSSRDQLLFNEVVPAGRIRVPVGAVTTECQFLVHWRPL